MRVTQHFHREIEELRRRLLSLGAQVEAQVHNALTAIETKDREFCNHLIETDDEINRMEIRVEEECLKILALYQPVATDLRFLVATIKINNDLERIADIAASIANRVLIISRYPEIKAPSIRLDEMGEKVEGMLSLGLNAFVQVDSDLAHKVCILDDEVDEIRNQAYGTIKRAIREHPEHVAPLMNYFLISRHLERLADHVTNIAEEVIYLVDGQIVRGERFN
ncbi:MAG: phosphate signaling complex protein PhoU [Desulfobulbaceae bacterium]|uniref:Phosphate-specific transport system accessory protein PhoU n=1 Tax=Candidatus Desulfatifera sulfidica TaxID=2841691 RepID=A0A8J6NAU2_9BACT|nr:phosphate signaling complex protein PhoU [Candidatus Desulfatifera sulfidica]